MQKKTNHQQFEIQNQIKIKQETRLKKTQIGYKNNFTYSLLII